MELDYYLFKHKRTQSQLAQDLKMSPARISLFVNKKVNPSLLTAIRIVDWTEGKVTFKELLKLSDRL